MVSVILLTLILPTMFVYVINILASCTVMCSRLVCFMCECVKMTTFAMCF